MPTVIDSLILELGLDASQFKRGISEMGKTIEENRTQLGKHGSEIEKKFKDVGEVFKSVTERVLTFFAAFAGVRSVEGFLTKVQDMNVSLANSATAMGTSQKALFEWRQMAKEAGGAAEDADAAISSMTSKIEGLTQFGKDPGQEWMRAFTELGGNLEKLPLENLKTAVKQLQELAAINPAKARELAKALDIKGGLLAVIFDPAMRGKLDETLEKLGKLGPTPQQTAEAKKFNQEMERLGAIVDQLGYNFATFINGALKGLQDLNAAFASFFEWLDTKLKILHEKGVKAGILREEMWGSEEKLPEGAEKNLPRSWQPEEPEPGLLHKQRYVPARDTRGRFIKASYEEGGGAVARQPSPVEPGSSTEQTQREELRVLNQIYERIRDTTTPGGPTPGGGGGGGTPGGGGGGVTTAGGGGGGTPGGGGGGGTPFSGNLAANQREAYQAARNEGLSDTAARALVANLTGEALGKPGDVHWDVKHWARGIASWDPTRAAAIKKQFGKLPNEMSVADQTKAAIWEIRNNPAYAESRRALERGTDGAGIVGTLVSNWERPLHPEADIAKRTGFLGRLPTDLAAGGASPAPSRGLGPTGAAADTKTTGAPITQGGNAAAVAMQFAGLRDRDPRGHALIMQFLSEGSSRMDPAQADWCARFVGQAVKQAGLGRGAGDVATSWALWGKGVSKDDIRAGDVVVNMRGLRPGARGGHVAIATGPAQGGRIPVIEGDVRTGRYIHGREHGASTGFEPLSDVVRRGGAGAGTPVSALPARGGTSLAMLNGLGAPGGAAGHTINSHNRHSNEAHIGEIKVVTSATDATGIARDLKPAIQRSLFATQANFGLA